MTYSWYIWEIIFPLSFLDFLYLPLILIIYCLTRGTQAAHAVQRSEVPSFLKAIAFFNSSV